MDTKFAILISTCFLLGACASVPQDQVNYQQFQIPQDQETQVALVEAATSVNQSITQLKATEQAAYPPVTVKEPPDPSTYGMNIPTSIEWDGPIQPLVQQIANAANYKLRVLGKEPSIPIIVSISAKDAMLGDVLRDVGYQSGRQAQVVVFPSTRVIELRYAQS